MVAVVESGVVEPAMVPEHPVMEGLLGQALVIIQVTEAEDVTALSPLLESGVVGPVVAILTMQRSPALTEQEAYLVLAVGLVVELQ